jgi:phage terminase Nu1 subunit (DNA packaging protein)
MTEAEKTEGFAESRGLPGDQLLNAAELADAFSITPQSVANLTRSGILERYGGEGGRKMGKYQLRASHRNYVQWKIKSTKDETEKLINAEKLAKIKWDNERSKIELAEKMGKVIEVRLVKIILADLAVKVKSAILAVPARLARKIINKDPRSILELMRQELERALNLLSKMRESDIREIADEYAKEDEESLLSSLILRRQLG